MKRRHFVRMGVAAPVVSGSLILGSHRSLSANTTIPISSIQHSICQWCYNDVPLEQLVEKCIDLNIDSIELLPIKDWDTVLSKGLTVAVGYANDWGLKRGFNNTKDHAQLLIDYTHAIQQASEKGIKQIICFSGNANGLGKEEGLENCAKGLDPIMKIAERYDITVCMELLNSKIDHADYQCDSTEWGISLVEKLGSSNFKLLYDIYHMQIMEGDIIRTITDNIDYISHFHTGGVPGRNEIDETQELNYEAIVKAIRQSGFEGFIAQEFIPSWDRPFDALAKAIDICTV